MSNKPSVEHTDFICYSDFLCCFAYVLLCIYVVGEKNSTSAIVFHIFAICMADLTAKTNYTL